MSPFSWLLLAGASPIAWIGFLILFWFVLPWLPFHTAKTRQVLEKISQRLLAWSIALVALAVTTFVLWVRLPKSPFENAIATAFNGKTNVEAGAKYHVVCKGFECDDTLRRLPPVSQVQCFSTFGLVGACCRAGFDKLGSAEIHIYWRVRGYEIELTEPRMREVLEALAQQSSSE